MSKVDTEAKNYLLHNDRFADIFNFYLYDGKRKIDPDALHPLDTDLITAPYGNDAREPKQRFRDIFKKWVCMEDGRAVYAVAFGCEAQNKVHYAMPVKNGLYDFFFYAGQVEQAGKSYRNQYRACKQKKKQKKRKQEQEKNKVSISSAEYLSGFRKGDRLIPVITLTIYLGTDEWDGPLSLKEMLNTEDSRVLELIGDYKVNLIAPSLLSDDDLGKFTSDFRELMEYIKYSNDWKKLEEVTGQGAKYRHLEPDAANLMNITTNSKLKFEIDEKEGTVDMCKAIEDMKEHYLQEEKKKTAEAEKKRNEEVEKRIKAEKERDEAENKRYEAEKKTNQIMNIALNALRDRGMTDADVSNMFAEGLKGYGTVI